MVVALGALQADAQEQLAHQRRDLGRLAAIAEERRRPVVPRAAPGRDQFADELVIRLVLAEALLDPGVVDKHRLDADAIGIGPQEVRPLGGPVIGVFRPLQERVHHPLALLRIAVGQKRAGLVRRRQAADDVQVDAAEEFLVVHRLGGRDRQRLELGPDQLVDEVLSRQAGVDFVRHFAWQRNRDARRRDHVHVAGHDRGLAGNGPGLYQARAIDADDPHLARLVLRAAGYVARRAVGIRGRDVQLQRLAGLEEGAQRPDHWSG
jgi:hypothetical protein